MSEKLPAATSAPLDPAEVLKMANEITQCVDGGHHKAYGTDPHRTTMTAGNAWWRVVADAMRAWATASPSETGASIDAKGMPLRIMAPLSGLRFADHIHILADNSLPQGTVEIKNSAGKVLGRIINVW